MQKIGRKNILNTKSKYMVSMGAIALLALLAMSTVAWHGMKEEKEEQAVKIEQLVKTTKSLEKSNKDSEERIQFLEGENTNVKAEIQKKIDEQADLNKTIEDLNKNKSELENQLNIKLEAKKKAVATPVSNPVAPEATEQAPTATPVPTSGTSLGTFNVTHYAVGDGMTPSTRTANGTDVSNGNIYSPEGYRVIATSPGVIPLNSIVRITLSNGESFTAKACDTGSAINGNKIDLLVSSPSEAIAKGITSATIEILN